MSAVSVSIGIFTPPTIAVKRTTGAGADAASAATRSARNRSMCSCAIAIVASYDACRSARRSSGDARASDGLTLAMSLKNGRLVNPPARNSAALRSTPSLRSLNRSSGLK
jgi:hypothetical protein